MGRRLEKNYSFCEPCFLSLFVDHSLSDMYIGNILLIYRTKCTLSRTKIHAQNKSDKIVFFQKRFLACDAPFGKKRFCPTYFARVFWSDLEYILSDI